MSAPTYIGVVTVWGMDGTMLYSGLLATDNLLENLSYEDTTEEHETKDKTGEVCGVKLLNPRENLNIVFYPSHPAGAGAIADAKANVVLPTKGAKVTIADMVGSVLNDTTWLYLGGGRIEQTNTGEVKITLPCRQYNTDIAATANT